MILPKFSQKLADFRPDFCRFCRFLLPRQTAKALYTFAAAIAAASGMYMQDLLETACSELKKILHYSNLK